MQNIFLVDFFVCLLFFLFYFRNLRFIKYNIIAFQNFHQFQVGRNFCRNILRQKVTCRIFWITTHFERKPLALVNDTCLKSFHVLDVCLCRFAHRQLKFVHTHKVYRLVSHKNINIGLISIKTFFLDDLPNMNFK